jgi:hypothetical protein
MIRSRPCSPILPRWRLRRQRPSGPSTGSLAVAVTGLPAGVSAAVTVTGPGGYTRDLGGTETLSELTPGSYTVTAEAVSSNGQSYEPSQATQSVAVGEGATPASAQVTYGLLGASLTVSIAGLPPGASGAVTVTGPAGYSHSVTGTTMLSGLAAGVYTVTALSVSPAGTQYNPSPSSQTVNLASGGSASANVSYTQRRRPRVSTCGSTGCISPRVCRRMPAACRS